jgi:hypothetical protein
VCGAPGAAIPHANDGYDAAQRSERPHDDGGSVARTARQTRGMFVPSPRALPRPGAATRYAGAVLRHRRGHRRCLLATMMPCRGCLLLLVAFLAVEVAAQDGARAGRAPDAAALAPSPAIARDVRTIAGWQVHVDARLLASEAPATERALALLGQMLAEIVRVVPATAVAALRAVPLYVSPAYPGQRSGAEYHPGAGWLRDHGRDPAMARAVEFSGVADFEREMLRMPNFALHELAHAYHDRVLPRGFANPAVLRAFEQAKADGRYAAVERWHGPALPTTVEPAYALTNAMEYFAEGTEAFFARNDFAPCTRAELQAHDPGLAALLAQVWGVAEEVPAAAVVTAAPAPAATPPPANDAPTPAATPTSLPVPPDASAPPAADRSAPVVGAFAALAFGTALALALVLVLAARQRRRASAR